MRKTTLQLNLPPAPLESLRDAPRSAPNSLREWRGVVIRAMSRSGLSQKAMACEMAITPQQLSDQLSGREGSHLSFWRMHALPKDFWHELVILVMAFYDLQIGISELDRRDMETGRALRELVTRVSSR